MYRPPWRVDLTVRAGAAPPLSDNAIATAAGRALDEAGAPSPASVAIVLTGDDELAELNREHMRQDGPTDVLSFPMLPPEAFPRSGFNGAVQPELALGRRIHIGDIAISVERAIEQAEQGHGGHTGDVRWSPSKELQLLVTHGVLHLCGWDHAEAAEEAEMRELERRLLG
jgi:probable rRNA maturation factor